MASREPHRLLSNRGGGCVEDFRVIPAPPGQHVLELQAPGGVARQLGLLVPQYRVTARRRGLTSTLRGPGLDLRPDARDLLGTLSDVLTLPCPTSLDYALALDWTKRPIDGMEARLWPETQVGDLVRRGKYWYKDAQRVAALREVGRALTAELCNLICRHVLLRTTTSILAVPGHDARVLSFGARLASSVAYELKMNFAALSSLSDFRTPAKNLDQSDRYAVIGGQFRCAVDLEGQSVLVVDDLYGSGTTAGEAARAARAAGATQVAVLCAVRTMKSS